MEGDGGIDGGSRLKGGRRGMEVRRRRGMEVRR